MIRERDLHQEERRLLTEKAYKILPLPVISGDVDLGYRKMILSVCARPEMQPLVGSLTFRIKEGMDVPFRVVSGDQVDLNPEILSHNSLAALFLRHAVEIAIWQSKMSGYASLAFFLSLAALSANTAKMYWLTMIEKEHKLCITLMPEKFSTFFHLITDTDWQSFLNGQRDEAFLLLIKALLTVQDMENVPDSTFTDQVFDEAVRLANQGFLVAAPTEYLLTLGGDDRLKIDKTSGLNIYGCSPKPRPWAVTFASTTATSISEYAFNQAEMSRQRLIEAACRENIDIQYSSEVRNIGSRIMGTLGLDSVQDAEVLLNTSGTDAELFALFFATCDNDTPIVNILVGPEETGSGTPLAASGCHFSVSAPIGGNVRKGEPVEGLPTDRLRLVEVPVRDNNGPFLTPELVDSHVKTITGKAVASGSRVLVHMVDSSKTGLSAPSVDTLKELKTRYGLSLDVLVDACQLRTGKKRLKEYLEAGFMVSVTGSKFYTGPPFSGALIIPAAIAARVKDDRKFPPGLASYVARHELPKRWHKSASVLGRIKNIGLLLRWEAALWEMTAFQIVSDKYKYLIFALFGESMRKSIEANSDLQLVSIPATERWKLPEGAEWDWLPTIFTFIVSRTGPRGVRKPVYIDEAKQIYRWLNMDITALLPKEASAEERRLAGKRYHIGQPVKIKLIGDKWVGALRISAGARLVSGVCLDPELGRHFAERLTREIGDACSALDKISVIIKYLDYIELNHENSEAPDSSELPYVI